MAIRSRASVQLLRVVQLAYAADTIDKLVSAIRDFDDRFTSGLKNVVDTKQGREWEEAFRRANASAFVDMLGVHCLSLSFDKCLDVVASPAHYCNSAGFAVWANKALLLHSACSLHGRSTYWRNDERNEVCV